MLAKVETATVVGLTAVPVMVEVDVSDGLPGVSIVGLPDATVRESRERIRSAVKNTQYAWPQTRVTVNLAPADDQPTFWVNVTPYLNLRGITLPEILTTLTNLFA